MRLADRFGSSRRQEVLANLVRLGRGSLGDRDRSNVIYGIGVCDHGHFIRRLEGGRVPEIPTIDKVRSYINGKTKAVK